MKKLFNIILDGEKRPEERREKCAGADVKNKGDVQSCRSHSVRMEEPWFCMRESGMAENHVRMVQDSCESSMTVVRCAW